MACKNYEDYKVYMLDSRLSIDGSKFGIFGQFCMFIFNENEYWLHWKYDEFNRNPACYIVANFTSCLKLRLDKSMLVWKCIKCGRDWI